MINFTIRGLQAILPIKKRLLSIWNGVFLRRRKKNQQQVLSDLASTTKGVNYIAELCLSTHTTDSKLRVCSFWTQASKTHLACIHFGDFAILTAVYIVRAVVRGGAVGALAPPEFESSVNPIPTRGGKLYPPHYC